MHCLLWCLPMGVMLRCRAGENEFAEVAIAKEQLFFFFCVSIATGDTSCLLEDSDPPLELERCQHISISIGCDVIVVVVFVGTVGRCFS
jgi:hypothetical protein